MSGGSKPGMYKVSFVKPVTEETKVWRTKGANRKPSKYAVYKVIPHEIGELDWDGSYSWTDDAGQVSPTMQIAVGVLENRAREYGYWLEPGRYRVTAKSVSVEQDQIRIVTAQGEEIVIYTSKRKLEPVQSIYRK